MEDIVPDLLEQILKSFREGCGQDPALDQLMKKVEAGTATYKEAYDYAVQVSEAMKAAYGFHISPTVLPDGKMYFNIADRLIPASMEESYKMVAGYAEKVTEELNQIAGIGIKAQIPALDQKRVAGIIEVAANADQYSDVANRVMEAMEAVTLGAVDDTVRENAKFHHRCGLSPKIIRKAEGGACKTCRALAGEYDYPENAPKEVFWRHGNCRCIVEYDPGDGLRRQQNVHTKKWTTPEESDKIEVRKLVGVKKLAEEMAQHPARLASFTPQSLKEQLEKEGYETKPLKRGSLKDIPFEKGGGFKVNFSDGGILQYHPASKSHHGGAYYKISTGKGGTHRYELDGTEKQS